MFYKPNDSLNSLDRVEALIAALKVSAAGKIEEIDLEKYEKEFTALIKKHNDSLATHYAELNKKFSDATAAAQPEEEKHMPSRQKWLCFR